MKRKIRYVLFVVSVLFAFGMQVHAAPSCSSTILYDEKVSVSDMNADWEVVEEEKYDPNGDPEVWTESYLLINILNVPANVRVDVTSLNDTFDKFSLSSADRDNNNRLTIKDTNAYVLRRYQFSVVSLSEDCAGETLKTFTLNTPMINTYADSASCSTFPDFKYCRQYVDFDISTLTNTEFVKEFDVYIKNLTDNGKSEDATSAVETIKNAFVKNWIIIIIVAVVLAGGLIAYKVIKKKRSRII